MFRKLLVVVVIIVSMAVGAGAAGAVGGYWHQTGAGYTCEGVTQGMFCKSSGFEIGITKSYVYLQTTHGKQMFGCRKWSSFSSCFQD